MHQQYNMYLSLVHRSTFRTAVPLSSEVLIQGVHISVCIPHLALHTDMEMCCARANSSLVMIVPLICFIFFCY